MILIIQYILFALVTLLFALVYPISGYRQQKRVVREREKTQSSKISWYIESMFWAWVPTIIIVTTILLSDYQLSDLGIKNVNLNNPFVNVWIIYFTIAFFVAYLGYNIYSIIVIKFSKESRNHSSSQLPPEMIAMLPRTKKEKRIWSYVAITAGLTEEIQYRGYLFFALPLIFPGIHLALILIISTILFGIGHLYQGKQVIRPTIAGLIFGCIFIVFDSIIPVIILHITQDLVVRNLLDE